MDLIREYWWVIVIAIALVLALVLLPAVRPWRARSRRRAGIG